MSEEKIELPPKYYLEYFNYVLAFVQDKYRSILEEREWTFLRKYYCLSEDAQCLFIRFCNRKGIFFRSNKLQYAEIENIEASLNELIERQFVEILDAEKHQLLIKDLLNIFTKDELIAILDIKALKKLKKPGLVETLIQEFSIEENIQKIAQSEQIIKVDFEYEVAFLKFLFFGNRYMDMTEFVVRDLGKMQYYQTDDDKLVARFNTRKDAEDKWLITDQQEIFFQLKDIATPHEIFDWFMNFNDCVDDELSEVAKPAYQRLIIRVATFLEKSKLLDEALEVYSLTEIAPSRERQIRILQKQNHLDEALALCQLLLEEPQNADEHFFALDFFEKQTSKKRLTKKSTTTWLHESSSITISSQFKHQVELGVIDYYLAQGKQAVFSENFLWRSIFGLIFWDIIFDPSLVAFHHPFQRRPSDLHLPDFYFRRREKIIAHLDNFENIQQVLRFMGEHYDKNYGIANPFVMWIEDEEYYPVWEVVRKAVELIDWQVLKLILHEMAKNLVENSRGFPDLFVWSENEYEFVEVKSPTDNLSNQQLYWHKFFEEVGLKSKVLRVFWDDSEILTNI